MLNHPTKFNGGDPNCCVHYENRTIISISEPPQSYSPSDHQNKTEWVQYRHRPRVNRFPIPLAISPILTEPGHPHPESLTQNQRFIHRFPGSGIRSGLSAGDIPDSDEDNEGQPGVPRA
ncbi:hypothetical protein TNCT_353271 [Trichonephila clavata]|uniref:Uncharacterized protein n=1 Tax=Trichonephila clavata TaxID=2740835 RepID=A0A8X6LV61_TRICU|nr:hypothetical protein TNCT_353271 [Trichonephila clavata]